MHQSAPLQRRVLFSQQHLDIPLQMLLRCRIASTDRLRMNSSTTREQSRRQHPRVIQHQQVARKQYIRKPAKPTVLHASTGAVNNKHARGGAILQRLLRDLLRRQLIVEIANQHNKYSRAALQLWRPGQN